MTKTIRWGVISTANIARGEVIPAIKAARDNVVLAVASRDAGKARAFATELGIERAYGPYEKLLADPDIDAIYNPLPNDGHAPWSIAAARAKKPTLVEKPIALNAPQAQQMIDAFRAEDVLLAEAFMYRYHPQHATVKKLIDQGVTGKPNIINVCFTYSMAESETDNVRLKPELGGGGLMDVGCYCVNLCRMIAGKEPESVTAHAVYGKKSGVDELFVGTLAFPDGLLAHFDCGMRSRWHNEYTIGGPDGNITVDYAFRQPDSGEAIVRIRRADAEPETIHVPPTNQYTLMIEDFANAVRDGRKVTYDPLDSLRNMTVLDALDRAAREGIAVRL